MRLWPLWWRYMHLEHTDFWHYWQKNSMDLFIWILQRFLATNLSSRDWEDRLAKELFLFALIAWIGMTSEFIIEEFLDSFRIFLSYSSSWITDMLFYSVTEGSNNSDWRLPIALFVLPDFLAAELCTVVILGLLFRFKKELGLAYDDYSELLFPPLLLLLLCWY